jgi:outer membrane lipoprotein-sorting protein
MTCGRRRAKSPVLAVAGIAALVAAVALFLFTRPTPAQAAYDRMAAAAAAVRTCHMSQWTQVPGTQKETFVLWYSDGKWRMEGWRDDTRTVIMVYDGQKLHTYDYRTNTLHLNVSDQPFGHFHGFTVAAMLSPDVIGADAEVAMTQVRDRAGRPLNRFEVIHEHMYERTVVLADPATDLPVGIESYMRVGSESDWEKVGAADQIEYNSAISPSMFVLTPPAGATIVDNEAITADWWGRYEKGMQRVRADGEEVILRDFQVASFGDAFAIWSPGGHQASLSDSLGTVYLQDTRGHGYFQAWSSPCAWFVPLQPPVTRPAWYVLRLEDCGAQFRINSPVMSPGPDPVYPAFKSERGKVAFLCPRESEAEIARAEIRAYYYRERGDTREALQWFEQMILLSDREMHRYYGLASTWLDIGALYEQASMPEKARDAYRRGLECHDRSPNRGNPDEVEDAGKLRASLDRLR